MFLSTVASGCSRQILQRVRMSGPLLDDVCLSSSGKGPGEGALRLRARVTPCLADDVPVWSHLCTFPVVVCLKVPDSCGENVI